MITVPVYVPSYGMSGDTCVVSVGDRVSWQLAVVDAYVPSHLLTTVEALAEPAESSVPAAHYYPTLLRCGGFSAWWDAGAPVVGRTRLTPFCALGDSRLPDDGVPPADGIVDRLYSALDLLRQRPDGPWDEVPALALAEVPSTTAEPSPGSFTPYFPADAPRPGKGRWRHVGWIALLRCA